MPNLVEISPVELEKMNFKIGKCIFAILLLSSLNQSVALHLNKLEFPSPKDACHLNIFKKILFNIFFYFVNVISLCSIYLPLEKVLALYLNKTCIPFTQVCFVPSLVEIGSVVLEKIEM